MDNVFKEIEIESKKIWKQDYVEEFSKKFKIYSENEMDEWQAEKCCEAYLLRFCTDEEFTNQILKIYGKWDLMTRSIYYSNIENIVGKHFCNFWECFDDKTKCIGDKTFK